MKTLLFMIGLAACCATFAQSRYRGAAGSDSADAMRIADPASIPGTWMRRNPSNGTRDSIRTADQLWYGMDTVRLRTYPRKRSSPAPEGLNGRDTILLPNPGSGSIDNMPNAFSVPGKPLVFKRNNGDGFDIYRSPIDNMPVLMPDSNNRSELKMVQKPYQVRPVQPLRKRNP